MNWPFTIYNGLFGFCVIHLLYLDVVIGMELRRNCFVGISGKDNFWSLWCSAKLESKWFQPLQVDGSSLCWW